MIMGFRAWMSGLGFRFEDAGCSDGLSILALAFRTHGLRVLKHREPQGTSRIDRGLLRRLQGRLVIILSYIYIYTYIY